MQKSKTNEENVDLEKISRPVGMRQLLESD